MRLIDRPIHLPWILPSALFVLLCAGALGSPAHATWSIVVTDSATQEVGVASVTCLTQIDLRAITPVVVVGKGAAAVQAAGDFDGVRRPIIRNLLVAGNSPAFILSNLQQIPGHQDRQYGIVDTEGRRSTFSGNQNADWAGGTTGTIGTLSYAIQGNILTGPCVVAAAEMALINTPGDLPTRLMAGMQAAKTAGGDGRCSCFAGPTGCGCPPPSFVKSGHIGYLLVARVGDPDDPLCNLNGCADGDYLYALNVGPQLSGAPDPVDQLQGLFDARRAALAGRPDAHTSTAMIEGLDPAAPALLTVTLRDYDLLAVPLPLTVTVEHAATSAGLRSIGVPIDLGGGVFEVPLAGASDPGLDRFRITVDDGFRSVVLSDEPVICTGSVLLGAPDCNGNGRPDLCDLADGSSTDADGDGAPDECPHFLRGDCNGDGSRDVADAIFSLEYLFGSLVPTVPCREACNTDGGEAYDLGDAITLLDSLFVSGVPLPEPFGNCGVDAFRPQVDCAMGTLCP